jgi:hypothetical protein
MRPRIAFIFVLFAVGCAHARFDSYREQEFTVCGNKWCGEDCWREAATKSCSGAAKQIGMNTQTEGFVMQGQYNAWTRTTSGTSRPIRNRCQVYSCSGTIQPWE